jgi:Na+-transporting NADH:ubiquinone oxidoreductase subunit C
MASPDAVPRESTLRTLLVALLVCGGCAALISTSVVLLRPIQQANQERDRRARVLAMVRATPGLAALVADLEAESLETRLVELATGGFAAPRPDAVWDVQQLAQDPERCTPIPPSATTPRSSASPSSCPFIWCTSRTTCAS